MKELFIDYPEAIELKAFGFIEHCIALYYFPLFYSVPAFLYVEDEPENNNIPLDLSESEAINDKALEEEYKNSCSAPTYEQAFEWIYEKYGLFANIQIGYGFPIWFSYQIVNRDKIWDSSDFFEKHPSSWSTILEAKRECLKRLIQIIKTKEYETK